MSTERNYYEILNSTSNASFDELKRNYKQLILQCHPDKLQQDKLNAPSTTATTTANSTTATTTLATAVDPNVVSSLLAHDDSEFVIINEAWNTLKDPVKRKQYDAELLLTKFQAHSNIFEHLTLADMEEHQCADATDIDTNFDSNTEKNQDSVETTYYYAYNCRCGGQYIIDESAATDNGIYNTKNRKNQQADSSGQWSGNNNKNIQVDCTNACQDFVADIAGDKNKVAGDTNDCEVMVECSECSLVIILSNGKQQSSCSS